MKRENLISLRVVMRTPGLLEIIVVDGKLVAIPLKTTSKPTLLYLIKLVKSHHGQWAVALLWPGLLNMMALTPKPHVPLIVGKLMRTFITVHCLILHSIAVDSVIP